MNQQNVQPGGVSPSAGGGSGQQSAIAQEQAPGQPNGAATGTSPLDPNPAVMSNSASAAEIKNAQALGTTPQSIPGMQQMANSGNPDQLQAMMQFQQQAQMNNYFQQLQQMQALQQMQQQQMGSSNMQGFPGNQTTASGVDGQQVQPNMTQQQQQFLQQAMLQQQQYNQLLSMSGPQQMLNQGYNMGQNTMNPQQLQGFFGPQFGGAPFNQTAHPQFMNPNQLYATHSQRSGLQDQQQNILNININGQASSQKLISQPRKGGSSGDYMIMEDEVGYSQKNRDPSNGRQYQGQTPIEKSYNQNQRHLSPIEVKNDFNRDLSAPKHAQNPKLNAVNFADKASKVRAQSKAPSVAGDDPQKRRSKSRKTTTFVQNNLAKETAASQKKLGGKISVRHQIKKQIYQLGKLEEALKEQKKRKASQSPVPPNADQATGAGIPGASNTSPIRNNANMFPQQYPPMDQFQQQQLFNQFLAQQQQMQAQQNLLGQQAFMGYQQMQNTDPQRRLTFQMNPGQVQQEQMKYPSMEQMQTPELNREMQGSVPKLALPPGMADQQAKTNLPGSKQSLESEFQLKSGRQPTENAIIGQTEIFDNVIAQPTETPQNAVVENQDITGLAQHQLKSDRQTGSQGPTPRSQQKSQGRKSAAEQRALSNRLAQPVERPEPKQVDPSIFPAPSDAKKKKSPKQKSPKAKSPKQKSPKAKSPKQKSPKSKKNTPRKDGGSLPNSSRKSGHRQGANSGFVPEPVINEDPIDLCTVDKLMQEEAEIEAQLHQDELQMKMDQQEIDDLIKQEQEFIAMKGKAKQEEIPSDPIIPEQAPETPVVEEQPYIDPMADAEDLFKQASNLNSVRSVTSSKKVKIKVSDSQRKKMESAKSNASNKQQPPQVDQPSLTIDQMIADVNAVANEIPQDSVVEVAPELSPDPDLKQQQNVEAEPSIGQLEKEVQQVVQEEQQSEHLKQPSESAVQKNTSNLTSIPAQTSLQEQNIKFDGYPQSQTARQFDEGLPSITANSINPTESKQEHQDIVHRQPTDPVSRFTTPQTQFKQMDIIVKENEPHQVLPENLTDRVVEGSQDVASQNKKDNTNRDLLSVTQEKPEEVVEEPEDALDLFSTKCLPQFEHVIKVRQEIIAMEVDSENEDTDGYLSEEIDMKKYQIGMMKEMKKNMQKDQEDQENQSEDKNKLNSSQEQQSDTNKSEKIKKMKEKQKKDKDRKNDKDDDDKEKKSQVALIREPYESMSHDKIKQSMYLSQRGLLYQVRALQQKKGHKFLIINSENNLYEYLQEHKEVVQIDKSGIFEINHPKKIYFEIFVIILAIYNCFGIPLEICFQPVTMEATEFVILNSIIDFIFGIDIYVQFKTTFYDPLSGDEVFDKKVIFWTYLKGRFIVDFMATVPFDNITYAITRQRISILPLFSLLKLIRITRLGRIIERMNVREHIKLMMKLSQIIFMLIMFIHCQACAWFYIVSLSKDWTAPLDGIDPNNDLYNDSTARKYLISVYYSILLLTCNDITPKGQWKIFFCASAVTLGAIINSIIFGNMALIIQNLNQKNSEFQESIDLANTAMKNMDMPKELQQDVVSYLQYTQQSQNGQQEFEYFYSCLSPSLRNEVIQLIFKEVTYKCSLFEQNKALIDFFIKSLNLKLLDPEYPLVNQGENDKSFFFIKSGECEVFVKHPETKRDEPVRILKSAHFFGEVSLLTGQPRTASVRPRIYAMIGYFQEQKFEEMVFMFPEVRSALQKHFFSYNDISRKWQREMLKNIQFMFYLQEDILDEMTISLQNDIFDENQEIFKQGQVADKVYILARGKIEIFLTIPEGELLLDVITEPGSVLSQISILNRMKLTYSARAKVDTEMVSISYEKLQEQLALNHMQTLNQEIEKFFDKTITPLNLEEKSNQIGFLDYQKKRPKDKKRLDSAYRKKLLQEVIYRQTMICRFQYKKDNILSDLIAELKKMKMDDKQKSMNKMKELVKSIAPIIVSKLKKLVSNRIKQVHQESLKQNQSIKNIHSIIQLINEQHKQKQQSQAPADKKEGRRSTSKKAQDDDASKGGSGNDKSPNKKYAGGVNKELQGIEEKEEEENKSSDESVDLTEESRDN